MGAYIKGFIPTDGLYQIQDGVIRKYKGKGGTVRPYELVEVKEPHGRLIDALCRRCDLAAEDDEPCTEKCNDIKILEKLPSAQPERQHGRVFNGIVVEYPSISTYPEYEGKPYFSIKYTENGQGFIGYGTYDPEVLSEYLKEYFMPSAQPEIIRCKDCKYFAGEGMYCGQNICVQFDHFYCYYGERKE